MIREFIKSSSVYSISSIIAQGLSFVLIPLYTRILNPSDYGFLDLVIVFATLVNLTVPLQISQGAAFLLWRGERQRAPEVVFLFCVMVYSTVLYCFCDTYNWSSDPIF